MSPFRRISPALSLLVLSMLALACGGARSSPEGAVSTFLDALEARDSAGFQASFTPGTWSLVRELEGLTREIEASSGQPAITMDDWCHAFCGGSVEGSTLHGDQATVSVRIAGVVEEIPVVRAGDEWQIDLEERYAPAVEMLRLIAAETPDTSASADSAVEDGATPDGAADTTAP